jgi:hypothetical protein
MDTQKAVQDLVKGSANLDRMKKEIPAVVNMIYECVGRSCKSGRGSQSNCWDEWPRDRGCFRAGNYEWEIEIRGERGSVSNPCRLVIECLFIEDFSCRRFRRVYSTDQSSLRSDNQTSLRLDDIQPVYESLSVLLQGVLELFPAAERQMKVFLQAADIF